MAEQKDKSRRLVIILAIVSVVLALVVIYTFAVRPAITGYVTNAQNEGANYVIQSIAQQIQQQGYAQIPVGNQTLFLAQVDPQQLQQAQQQIQETPEQVNEGIQQEPTE